MASRAIGFRNEAETLRSKKFYFAKYIGLFAFSFWLHYSLPDSFRISQEHAKQIKEKLNASEIARKKAEAKARDAEGLQAKLNAAERALKEAQDQVAAMKDRIDQVDARETELIKRFDAQSEKFGGKILLSMVFLELI